MKKCNRIAIDLAKNVFEICILGRNNRILGRQRLKRAQLMQFIAKQSKSRIVMEACYSSHYWAREFTKLGHTVDLIPPQHVKPFLRGNKNDHNDALAIAEAADRPNIITVPIKTIEQQDIQALHRIRDRLVCQRTQLMNQLRGLLSEYGIIANKGHHAFCKLLTIHGDSTDSRLTVIMKHQVRLCAEEYYSFCDRIEELNQQLRRIAQSNPLCRILLSMPGIGYINATALMASIGNGAEFRTPREMAVWLGLTPRQHASGDKSVSLGITKRGNCYLRKQLIHGARAAIGSCKKRDDNLSQWVNRIVARRGVHKACVALANRLARLAWVLLQKNEKYQPQFSH